MTLNRIFHNLRIRHRLFIGYAVIFAITAVSTATIYFSAQSTLKNQAARHQDQSNQRLRQMVKVTTAIAIKNNLRAVAEKNLSILTRTLKLVSEGKISSRNARVEAEGQMLSQSTGANNYIYGINSSGVIMLSPKIPKAHNGFFPFKKDLGNREYRTLQTPTPKNNTPEKHGLYAIYFKPWDMFLVATSPMKKLIEQIKTEELAKILSATSSDGEEFSVIVDLNGKIISSPADITMDDIPMDIVVAQKTGKVQFKIGGKPNKSAQQRVAVFGEIPEYEWIVISVHRPNTHKSATNTLRIILGITALITLLLGIPIIQKISASITEPLQSLMNYFSSGAIDDFNIRMEIDSKDEIGELAWYFNKFMNKLEVYSTGLQNKIMERQRAENSLKESKELFDAFMCNLPALAFMKNTEGNYIYLNSAYIRTVSHGEALTYPMNTYDLWPAKTAEKMNAADMQVIRENKTIVTTERVRIDDRDEYFSVTKFPVIQKNGPSLIAGIAFNITGKTETEKINKQLELQLRKSQKMEAIGTLAGGIAHDFNNILAGIIGYTELSLSEAPAGSKLPHKLNQILKASSRARDLVRQILTFSRQQEQEKKPVQLDQIIKETLKLIQSTLPSNISTRFRSKGISPMILADLTQIHQVLMNLLTNSAHAMQEHGGTLEVNLFSVEISDTQTCSRLNLKQGRYVKISVKDTGSGMDPDILDRIFDPFFTTKQICEGSGMGLSVVHGIVQSHNGSVEVTSRIKEGTSFHLYFPEITSSIGKRPTNSAPTLSSGKHILYVDNEEMITEMARETLSTQGFRVTTVSNGTKALKLFELKPNRFDLVITDQTMPNLSGGELCEKILAIRPEQKIVLSSGYNESMLTDNMQKKGPSAFILKPFTRQELLETIAPLL